MMEDSGLLEELQEIQDLNENTQILENLYLKDERLPEDSPETDFWKVSAEIFTFTDFKGQNSLGINTEWSTPESQK
jgi:hypothetical protein